MSGFRNGFIKLDSPRDVFYPGQVILGSVVFEIEQPFSLVALYVDFVGEAKVGWTEIGREEYNGVRRYNNIDYVGRESYFNVRQLLAGGNVPVSLPPGTHTYQFSYQLPPGIPSTFSGERGGISYCVKASLELRGQGHLNQTLDKYFDVVAPFDLNLGSPKLKEPIDLEFEDEVGCSCFGSSQINVLIRLPVSGYCPGQVIPVTLDVKNNSSVEIRKIVFQILSRERYRTQRPVSEYVPPGQVVSTITKGAIMSGTNKILTVDVKLPDLIAPNLENCGIIDVGYFFKAIIKLSGCNSDLKDEAEICLGLVPLKETVDGEYSHPLSQSLPIGPIPNIPVNQEERHVPPEQASYQTNTGFSTNAGYPSPPRYPSDENVQSSYTVQVQKFQFSSSDPSKNYHIGFTMTSPDPIPTGFGNSSHFSERDLRIHLPQPSVNVNAPSAPPPSR